MSFHFTPDVFNLLVDTIQVLNRSKDATVLFFQGAGVTDDILLSHRQALLRDRESVRKRHIVVDVLTKVNERQDDKALRMRREIVRRVVEFDDFNSCWESDRHKAKSLVGDVQKLVNTKDTWTQIVAEKSKTSQQNQSRVEAEVKAKLERRKALESIRTDLFGLFGSKITPSERGKKLEYIFSRLFEYHGIRIRTPFTVKGLDGEGVIEQIDGVVDVDGHLYFVEIKWWDKPVDVPAVTQHISRVLLRGEGRALIISGSSFTAPAITTCRDALSIRVITLSTVQELVQLIERDDDLKEFIRVKTHAAIADRNPFKPFE